MYKRILVAVDNSETSRQALATAIRLAATVYARLRLVHVLEAPARLPGDEAAATVTGKYMQCLRDNASRILHDGTEAARSGGAEAESILVEGNRERVGESVVRAAKSWGADLIVMGTHGRRGVHHLLMGSDAEEVIRSAPVNVLVVRAGS